MPPCTLHLLSLVPNSLPEVLQHLTSLPAEQRPLVISKPIRWIITPKQITSTTLLNPPHPYDLLIVLPNTSRLSNNLTKHLRHSFTLTIGLPSSIHKNFESKNQTLLHPPSEKVPPLTGSLDSPRMRTSTQDLTLTPELLQFASIYDPIGPKWAGRGPGAGAVSMLNLLSFVEGQHGNYQKYGQAFAQSIGSRRGGSAKIVGKVIPSKDLSPDQGAYGKKDAQGSEKGWEEVALAQYPSIWHFVDMAGSEDYQEANERFRLGALRDTCILMTSEIEVEKELERLKRARL